MKKLEDSSDQRPTQEIIESILDASHWIVASGLFLLFLVILVFVKDLFFYNYNGITISFIDIILFLSVPYFLVRRLNKYDKKHDDKLREVNEKVRILNEYLKKSNKKLRQEYVYVMVPLNDKWGLAVCLIHILFIFILPFCFPTACFYIIAALPFCASIYRIYCKNKTVFPEQISD